jgi:hypothetical protein
MRRPEVNPPFKFHLSDIVRRLKRLPVAVDGAIKIKVPFFEVTVKADDREKTIAREVVIRLSDRRVLNAQECCGECIREALTSLKEIRQILVNKKVELSDKADSAIYILMDSIREAIRQFLIFEERLSGGKTGKQYMMYLAGLEILRAHIHRLSITHKLRSDHDAEFDVRES